MFGFILYQRSVKRTTYESNELYDKLLVYKKPKKNDNNKQVNSKNYTKKQEK